MQQIHKEVIEMERKEILDYIKGETDIEWLEVLVKVVSSKLNYEKTISECISNFEYEVVSLDGNVLSKQ